MKKLFLLLLSICTLQVLMAQLTLPGGTSYTQDFNSLSTGLPTGWTVRTGATSVTLGTTVTPVSTPTGWTVTTGNFRNVASGNSPQVSATSTASQATVTDRALALKQTGSFGDPNGAFVLQIANTSGKYNFGLSLKHQVLDDQPRASTYVVEYSTDATGNSGWNTINTFTTGVTTTQTNWGVTPTGNLSLGTALDNNASSVWIRIRATTSTGSGTRDTYGIDDFSLSWTNAAPAPALAVNTGSFNGSFGNVTINTSSTSSAFSVSATNLTNNVTITAPAGGFEIRTGANAFSTSPIVLTQSGGTVSSTNIDVRFSPTAAATQSGNISVTSTGATQQLVAVSGTGTAALPPVINFNTTAFNGAFGNVLVNNTSTSSAFIVSGANLTDNVTLTVPAGFQFRTGANAFATTPIVLTQSAGTLGNTTIDVLFAPTVSGAQSGNILLSSTGANTQTVTLSGTGVSIPTKYAITGISPASPSVNSVFSVTVQSQDASNVAQNVTQNSSFELSVSTGTGVLSNINGTITAGTSQTVVTTTYSVAEGLVSIAAMSVSGDNLITGFSGSFTVNPVATQLAFGATPTNYGQTAAALPNLIVRALLPNSTVDVNYTGPITVSITSGPGALSGTVTVNAVAGVATFTNVIPSNTGVIQIRATSGSLTPVVSSNIQIFGVTEDIMPQYIQGVTGTNNNRIPFAYRLSLSGLTPNATYRYINQVAIASDLFSAGGAGNPIFTNTSTFVYTSGPSFTGTYGSLTADASGNYTGWFVTEPTANSPRFIPGTQTYMRLSLNDGMGGTVTANRITAPSPVTVVNLVSGSSVTNGTGLAGFSFGTPKNFVFAYDNTAGTGRPLSGTFIESDGNTAVTSVAPFYRTGGIDGVAGAYGMVIPSINNNGVRRLEQRAFNDGTITGCPATNTVGFTGTVNPTGGATAVTITNTDAPLICPSIVTNTSTFNGAFGDVTTGTNSIVATYSVSATLLQSDLIITPPAGFEISTGAAFSSNAITLTPTSGTVNATNINVRFVSSNLGFVSGTITHTSTNATTQNVTVSATGVAPAIPTKLVISTISPASPVVNTTFSVTVRALDDNNIPQNVVANTDFTLSVFTGTGSIGTVTGTILAGTNSVVVNASYNVAQTGVVLRATRTAGDVLTAGNSAPFTVLGVATQLVFGTVQTSVTAGATLSSFTVSALRADNSLDMNFNGNITVAVNSNAFGVVLVGGTRVVAAVNGVATFNSASVSVYQPSTGGTVTLGAAASGLTGVTSTSINVIVPMTELIFPQFAVNGTTTGDRMPYTCRVKLNGLTPNATYRYVTGGSTLDNITTATTPGNFFAINNTSTTAGYIVGHSSNKSLAGTLTDGNEFVSTGRYAQLTTEADGSYTGWFSFLPSGNAVFNAGGAVYFYVQLNNGAGGTAITQSIRSTSTISMLATGTTPTFGSRSVRGASFATPENPIFLYSNTDGTGRPLYGSWAENDGITTTFTTWYNVTGTNGVDGVNGSWGAYIPTNLASGIQRIEQRSIVTGNVTGVPATDANGVWPVAGNTVNVTASASNPIVFTAAEAPLVPTALLSGNVTICNGASADLSIAFTGQAPFTYAINAGANVTTTNNPETVTVMPTANQTYALTSFGDVNGVGNFSGGATVTVNANPAAAILGVNTICAGANTNLTAQPNDVSYLWSTSATAQVITINSGGTFTLTVTDTNNCTATASKSVAVTILTFATASTPTSATATQGTTSVTVTSGASPYTFRWSTGATTSFINAVPGAYTVTATDANGCTGVQVGRILSSNPVDNDLPCNYRTLTNLGAVPASNGGITNCYSVQSNNIGASDFRDPTSCGTLGDKGVFYSFRMPSCGTTPGVRISTNNAGTTMVGTNVAVYTVTNPGSCISASYQLVRCNSSSNVAGCSGSSGSLQHGTLEFAQGELVSGGSYYIYVSGDNGSEGNFELTFEYIQNGGISVTAGATAGEAVVSMPNNGQSQFKVQWRPVGSTGWATSPLLTGLSYTLPANSLMPGVSYEFKALYQCAGTNWVLMSSDIVNFSTVPTVVTCAPVAGLSCNNVSGSVTTTWSPVPAGTSSRITVALRNGASNLAGSTVASTVTSVVFANRPNATSMQVQSNCGGAAYIAYSNCAVSAAGQGAAVVPVTFEYNGITYEGIDFNDPSWGLFGAQPEGDFEMTVANGQLIITDESTKASGFDFELRPSVATDFTNVVISTEKAVDAQLSLNDINGSLISSQMLKGVQNGTIVTLETSELPAGLYIVSVRTEEGNVAKKLVVVK